MTIESTSLLLCFTIFIPTHTIAQLETIHKNGCIILLLFMKSSVWGVCYNDRRRSLVPRGQRSATALNPLLMRKAEILGNMTSECVKYIM